MISSETISPIMDDLISKLISLCELIGDKKTLYQTDIEDFIKKVELKLDDPIKFKYLKQYFCFQLKKYLIDLINNTHCDKYLDFLQPKLDYIKKHSVPSLQDKLNEMESTLHKHINYKNTIIDSLPSYTVDNHSVFIETMTFLKNKSKESVNLYTTMNVMMRENHIPYTQDTYKIHIYHSPDPKKLDNVTFIQELTVSLDEPIYDVINKVPHEEKTEITVNDCLVTQYESCRKQNLVIQVMMNVPKPPSFIFSAKKAKTRTIHDYLIQSEDKWDDETYDNYFECKKLGYIKFIYS